MMLLFPPNTQRQQHATARLPSLGSACAQPQKIETSGTNSPPTLRARSLRHSTEHLHAGLSTNKPQACSSPDRRQANTAMSTSLPTACQEKYGFTTIFLEFACKNQHVHARPMSTANGARQCIAAPSECTQLSWSQVGSGSWRRERLQQ